MKDLQTKNLYFRITLSGSISGIILSIFGYYLGGSICFKKSIRDYMPFDPLNALSAVSTISFGEGFHVISVSDVKGKIY